MSNLLATLLVLTFVLYGCGCSPSSDKEAADWVAQAESACKAGDFERCVQLATTGLKDDPQNWMLLEQRGYALYQLKKYNEATVDCNKALDTVPAEARYRILGLRAGCSWGLGQYDKAEEDYAAACQAIPASPERIRVVDLWRYRARNLQDGDRLKESIACYDEALKLMPKHLKSLTGRALAYAELGDKAGFLADYAVLQKQDPKVAKFVNDQLKKKSNPLAQP